MCLAVCKPLLSKHSSFCNLFVQLCAAAIGEEALFSDCFAVLRDAYNYCMDSPQRQATLRFWQEISEVDQIKLVQLSQVWY